MDDIFRGVGVEITLRDDNTFLVVKETLTRIGIASSHEKTLYQTAHILHKRGRYAICHFKEMFILDGKESTFSSDDQDRRDAIACLLQQWGLVTIVGKPREIGEQLGLKVLPHSEKANWTLVPKYVVGRKPTH